MTRERELLEEVRIDLRKVEGKLFLISALNRRLDLAVPVNSAIQAVSRALTIETRPPRHLRRLRDWVRF